MKKRQLFSLIITALLLCALLPTLAFAGSMNPEGSTLPELSDGQNLVYNYGTVETNNGTIDINEGTVTTNNGTIESNNEIVTTNNGTITTNSNTLDTNSNTGTVANNFGTVANNFGTINDNRGSVANNFGTVTSYIGTVTNNYGATTIVGSVPEHQFWEVTVKGGEHATNTGITTVNDNQWIEEGKTAVFSPASGYAITAATTTDGTITKGADGKWTLSGVTGLTDSATVSLTVAAVPKTGVDRDTGILTALALVSGIILVTALPKKKTGVKD